jgi:hypothetical protein
MTTPHRLLVVTALALAACQAAELNAVVYYDFALLPESEPAQHYQQFADVNGGVAEFGCLVVERRQVNCYDNAGTGEPNLRLGVVECECPCAELEADPCDPTRPMVRKGIVRGLVNQVHGQHVLGGVELPTPVDLAEASRVFITVEANDDASPAPGAQVILRGALESGSGVLTGALESPTGEPTQGKVTIVPVRDEVSL